MGVSGAAEPIQPWAKEYLGPPGSPGEHTRFVNGTGIISNKDAGPAESFYADFEKNLEAADNRWKGWYGALHAGPMNTHRFNDCFMTTCNCGQDPQPMPPAAAL